MKRLIFIALLLFAATCLGVVGWRKWRERAASPAHAEQLYTCGMHPQIIQKGPGNCPICGMRLTPLRKQPSASQTDARTIKFYKSTMMAGETSPVPAKDSMGMEMVPVYEGGSNDSAVISIDPVTIQNMGIRTEPVMIGPVVRSIRAVSGIDYDETLLADVTTKVRGWIEKLYVDATGRQVHKGEPLFELYSPELYNAQTELVLALDQRETNSPSSRSLKASALQKLRFFDISPEQIAELERTRQVKKTLRVQAPIDGFVLEKMAIEGQMVEMGMKLYRLADLSLVWVQAQIYEKDLPFIQLGQEALVTLSYLPDRKFRGRVTYIYPTLDEKSRTARVRMEFHNPGYFLKPGMYANVEIRAELNPAGLLVPDSAVLRGEARNNVFVALPEGRFEPRVITLGARSENNRYEVLSGLAEGDRVVTSGQFMLDSESQLREAVEKMKHTAMAGAGPPTNAAAPLAGHLHAAAAPDKLAYICPMPEHVSIQYEHPGKCPICGMTLVPVSMATLARLEPGRPVLYYTCPMPEHSDVRVDKPGKCPRCGMTLIPIMADRAEGRTTRGQTNEPVPAGQPAVKLPSKAAEKSPVLYTCPMASHADVVSDQPGFCTKCEMKLVPTSTVPHGAVAEKHWREMHVVSPKP